MATVGKNILENLTTGMYHDSKVCYREYIQNACDQIDIAIKQGLLRKEEAVVDSRLITDANMGKLSEVNIRPLRIAFDHWELRDIYERSIRTAVRNGITNLSNYLLYNFEDRPEHLYYRLRMNVDLCDELGASIYSFPMKYHPINDQEFFRNRDFIGKHWNRKFIRAVQAVLNSTKGKIGRGKEFFEEAFGRDVDEFWRLLWMPEEFIIYRRKYDAELRERLADRYTNRSADD